MKKNVFVFVMLSVCITAGLAQERELREGYEELSTIEYDSWQIYPWDFEFVEENFKSKNISTTIQFPHSVYVPSLEDVVIETGHDDTDDYIEEINTQINKINKKYNFYVFGYMRLDEGIKIANGGMIYFFNEGSTYLSGFSGYIIFEHAPSSDFYAVNAVVEYLGDAENGAPVLIMREAYCGDVYVHSKKDFDLDDIIILPDYFNRPHFQ